ncbi:MAG: helix-turn-helix domain-containing protein [Azoarcus sp.]|jgi:AraC family ethanolamine operon transcriptional activator|nr:helix-turn-helix domain-containing protein [Azoarcus sp.]
MSTLPAKTAPVIRQRLRTADIDEHAACLFDWKQHYDQLSPGIFAGEFEEIVFGPVRLFREGMNQTVLESGILPAGSHGLAVIAELDGDGWFDGQAVFPDSLLLVHGGERFNFRTPRQHQLLAAVIDTARLCDYARQVEHHDPADELGRQGLPGAAPGRAAAYRAFLLTLFTAVRATPQMLESRFMQRAMEQALHGAILEALGGGDGQMPAPARLRQTIIERARACVNETSGEPLSVADLCMRIGVSRRALQNSFQEVLDLNPVKFLRAMRLNGVRRALREAGPQGNTVGDIAARWGFWHLSRFAADYREMFGERPSDTLKKAMPGL